MGLTLLKPYDINKKISLQTKYSLLHLQFASSKNWDIYKQIEREINVLQGLNNIGIPKYIETIDHIVGA
ncbi:MAG: hypothetical protein WBM32_01290 [Crocosphaera sp.]